MSATTRWITLSRAVFAAWLLGINWGAAADCLPPELEKATPEVQTAYWNRLRLESFEQKAQVAQVRYNRRLDIKRSIARDLQTAATLRLVDASARIVPDARSSEPPKSTVASNVLLWGGIILGILYLLLKHLLPKPTEPPA